MRFCCSLCTYFMCATDLESCKIEKAMFYSGPNLTFANKRSVKILLMNLFRQLVSSISLLCMTYYNFTIDLEGTETSLSFIQNFTSLVIIIEIDNILVGYLHQTFEQLELDKFMNENL